MTENQQNPDDRNSATYAAPGRDRSDLLAKNWQPGEVEKDLYDAWESKGYFRPDEDADKPAYSVVLPPPNVTGQLHMGHALDHTLMDSIIRRKRMQGFPRCGCRVRITQALLPRRRWKQSCASRKANLAGITRGKISLPRFGNGRKNTAAPSNSRCVRLVTPSTGRASASPWMRGSRAVQHIFKQMFDAGMIYRAHRLVNWSPVLETAVSDIEVVHKDVDGELVSLRYGSLADDEDHVIVATTRVETMLGDVAVAVHPDDERYTHLVGKKFPHPFRDDLELEVIADDYVDPEFGSGAVKITPAHDPNDYAVGLRHNLDMPTVMDTTGHIAGTGTQFDGLSREEARVKVREALAEQGRIVAEKRPYTHSVGHSERSGEPIEPRLSLQWFVKVDKLAQMAGDAVREGDTKIHPTSMEPRYFDWVDDMHDWTISRQLWWGHRIPIWYGPEDENGERDIVCVGPDEQAPEGYEQDPDVLDTWFSSALWPFSTMGWPDKTADLERYFPTSVLVTAYDILFFWVARMMMFGTFAAQQDPETFGTAADGRPQVPFKDLYLHGLVRDEHGRKMSKSLGNGIDPMDWVRDYGADALRFTLARGANPGVDLPVGDEAAEASKRFATKLFNATKFALMNGAGMGELPERSELTDADRWILDRTEQVRAQVDKYLDDYQFAKANELLYHFAWGELCDWYVEIAKTQVPREGSLPKAGIPRSCWDGCWTWCCACCTQPCRL